MKFRKIKVEKTGEISRNLPFPRRSDYQTALSAARITKRLFPPLGFMCLQVNLDAEFVLSNLDVAQKHTSPLVKQGFASDRDLPGLQSHACNEAYVIISRKHSQKS